MTTLVYCKDVIAADSLLIITAGNNTLPLQGQKVFINKAKTLGYGICGHYIINKDIPVFEEWLDKQLTNYIENKPILPLFKQGRGFHVVIMSAKGTYVINHAKAQIKIETIDPLDYFVNGTGGDNAVLPIVMGEDAIAAVTQGKKYDPVSGCDIYAVKRTSLKPHKVY